MIGYYVHHHGRGHLASARTVARHLSEPVTILSSLPEPAGAAGSPAGAAGSPAGPAGSQPGPAGSPAVAPGEHRWYEKWITLPLDVSEANPVDATANGHLHWAPLGHAGLRRRTSMIVEWIDRHRPRAFVVDVSVEVTLAARLTGTPTAVVVLPGDRSDRPHQTAYGVADLLIAPWPETIYRPSWLRPHLERTTYVGGFGRFDGRPVLAAGDGPPTAVVLGGRGGSVLADRDVTAYARALPDLAWVEIGTHSAAWRSDPWPDLCRAAVVVSHAGLGAVSEIAAAARPAVLLPQARPFDEQTHTAQALDAHQVAVSGSPAPEPEEMRTLVTAALQRGGAAWRRWSDGSGGRRAAAAIERLADRHRVGVAS